MNVGVITRNSNSWSSVQLQKALAERGIPHACLTFPKLIAKVGWKPGFKVGNNDILDDFDALIIRPVGRGSVEELVFRMDVLYRLQRSGMYVVNPPEAIEHCVDKYDVLAILEENDLPVPRTATTENADEALSAFKDLGEDVVVKPLFGSRGIGATRIKDAEVALTVFRAITFYHGVIYVQEFVPHGFSDIRAFVIGHRVVAAMRRVAQSWKTNYSQGAKPESFEISKAVEDMAIKSAKLLGCKIAGVDILEGPKRPVVVEVNSQPGWRGLQSVTGTNIALEIIDFTLSELKK